MNWFEIKDNVITNIIVAEQDFISSIEGEFILRTENNEHWQIGYVYNEEIGTYEDPNNTETTI
jgi:hypothetical protein